jgi:hypothetical protein
MVGGSRVWASDTGLQTSSEGPAPVVNPVCWGGRAGVELGPADPGAGPRAGAGAGVGGGGGGGGGAGAGDWAQAEDAIASENRTARNVFMTAFPSTEPIQR